VEVGKNQSRVGGGTVPEQLRKPKLNAGRELSR